MDLKALSDRDYYIQHLVTKDNRIEKKVKLKFSNLQINFEKKSRRLKFKIFRFVDKLLKNKAVTKIAFSFYEDILRLQNLLGDRFDRINNFVELFQKSHFQYQQCQSLTQLCFENFFKPLDKSQQKSNWSQRPLSRQ